jgi:hypothetical protein
VADAAKPPNKRKRGRRWSRLAPLDLALMLAAVGGGTLFVVLLIFIGFSAS